MTQKSKLNNPIMIAAWPGMGHVAVAACYYLIAKLEMQFRSEYAGSDLFDVDHVAVKAGLVQPFQYPKNQFFTWSNPNGGSDLLIFIGEAQPPIGRYNFCRKLIDYALGEGVTKIFTFAAMATAIDFQDESSVIGVATDAETVQQLLANDVGLLNNGSISGMNGILLGVASERKIPGGCLLGEMPASLVNLPYPRASLAVLKSFGKLTQTEFDLEELQLEVHRMDEHLIEALNQFRRLEQDGGIQTPDDEETFIPDPTENGKLSADEEALLENLFEEAKQNRAKAFKLKHELDRLNVFREYEDRFLDLFKVDENE